MKLSYTLAAVPLFLAAYIWAPVAIREEGSARLLALGNMLALVGLAVWLVLETRKRYAGH